jgi:hypothetical protein
MSEALVIGVDARLAWQAAFRDSVEILQKPYIDEVKRRLDTNSNLARNVGPINGAVDIGNIVSNMYFDLKRSWHSTRMYPIYGVLKFIKTEPELKHQLPMALETLKNCFFYAASKVGKEIKSSPEGKMYVIDDMPNINIKFQNYKFNPTSPYVIDDLVSYLTDLIVAVRVVGTRTSKMLVFQMITIAEECWITSYLANPHGLALGRNESARLRNRFMKEAVLIAKQPVRPWTSGIPTPAPWTYLALEEVTNQATLAAAAPVAQIPPTSSSSSSPSLSSVATDVKSVNPSLSVFGRPVVPIGFRPAGPAYQSYLPAVNNGNSSSSSSSSSGSSGSSSGVSKMDISKTGGRKTGYNMLIRRRFFIDSRV